MTACVESNIPIIEPRPEPPEWLRELIRLQDRVLEALEYTGGTHEIQDVAAMIESGQLRMMTSPDSIMLIEVQHYPRKKICHVFLAGGTLEGLAQMRPALEIFAKREGCAGVSLAGRRGWERTFLKDEGYAPKWYTLYKEFE